MKVIFLDSVHPILEKRLTEAGYECIHDYKTPADSIALDGFTGIVIRSRFRLSREFLSRFPSLKWIARSGSGLENIDLIACEELGIKVYNSPEGNSTAVAEHATGMLLMLFNKLRIADSEVRSGLWQREANRGLELEGKTVGIIGYGVMGSAFAKRLSGFGCRVLAYDKHKSNFGNEMVQEVSLDTLKKESDIVSLHVPLLEDTKYLVDADWIASFSKPFYIINTSRGQVAEIKAILDGLKSNKILGACLDVLEYEETSFEKINLNTPEFNELKELNNVIFSPHVAGWTVESYEKLSSVLADKILGESGI
ncbi:MAG: NAD(P)-dependent oxidoreductase [Flavobacteriales bacterium]